MEAWPWPGSHSCPERPCLALPAPLWMMLVFLPPATNSLGPRTTHSHVFSYIFVEGPQDSSPKSFSSFCETFVNSDHVTRTLACSHWLHTYLSLIFSLFTIRAPQYMCRGLSDLFTRLFPAPASPARPQHCEKRKTWRKSNVKKMIGRSEKKELL